MDRRIIYTGAIPQDIDLLLSNQNAMVGLGYLTQAILGTGTLVDGLACTPTTPASLSVLVAPGSIYGLQSLEPSAYGSVAADTTHQIVKQGIVLDATTLACPAPGTSGQSRVYLVEVAYQDIDDGAAVLPYYNAANPSQAFAGPNNTGVSQNTVRKGVCKVQVKAGVAATTGTQVTPAPTAGFTGLYAVTVANGQSTINSGNIVKLGTAPYFPKLTDLKALALLGIGAGLYDDGAGNLAARSTRTTLTANRTYYVRTDGSDANTGLANTAGGAFATIQKAVTLIQQTLDLGGYTVTIQVADGVSNQSSTISGPFYGSGDVIIRGNPTTPANCGINTTNANCFYVTQGARVSILGFDLSTSVGGWGIYADNNSVVSIIGNMNYNSVAGTATSHLAAADNAVIKITADYTISGGGSYHWSAIRGGRISDMTHSIAVSGTPTFTAFANVIVAGSIYCPDLTFTGTSVTGARYSSNSNGVIDTGGAGASYLPGSTSGTMATGGQYL